MSKARDLSNFISDATVDATEIADLAVTHAKLHTDMNLSSKTLTLAANQISGNSVDGGVISNFASTGIDDNASSTAVTILSDGKVGIGIDTPLQNLAVKVGSDIIVSMWGDNAAGYGAIQSASVDNSTYKILRFDASSYNFIGGNVGIGTSSPGATLHTAASSGTTGLLVQGAANNNVVHFANSNGVASLIINEFGKTVLRRSGSAGTVQQFEYGSAQVGGIQVQSTGLGIGGGARENDIFIKTDGNVGIGVTSPTSKLHVDGTVHSIFGYSMRYLKTINLTTSYQDIVATGGGTPSNVGWLIATSSENNFHQAWIITYSTNAIHDNYLGGSQGHTHSLDVQWRVSGGHVQAKKTYNTGRPLTVFMVAGSMSADYD